MSASGRIDLSVSFSDVTSKETKQISKFATIVEQSDYTSVVVAIISGTIGTASTSVALNPTTYRDANGDLVSFTGSLPPSRIALRAENENRVTATDIDLGRFVLMSSDGQVSCSSWVGSSPESGITVQASGGTNSYSIILYRES